MTLSRRRFTALAAGAAAGLALPRRRQESYFRWVPVRDDVQVAVGGGGNSLLYLGPRGALVSDGKNFGLGRALRAEAESFGVTVTHFVNTHHHGDHTGGNEGFPDALKVAHANAAPRIAASAEAALARAGDRLAALEEELSARGAPPHVQHGLEELHAELDTLAVADFTPDRVFLDEYPLSVDGLPVELRWVSPGHTDGDVFVFLPRENVLHCGDLLFHGRHPYVDDTAGATPAGWLRCLDAMLARCDADTAVVPGHGEVTDRAGLAAQGDYFRRLQGVAADAHARGLSREQVQGLVPDGLGDLPGADPHLARNLGLVFDEVAAR
ncbi:MAG: MBL fold metallo-hydrolase [Longimicrobiales bacterium]|nr:MBL fold metallo-hydrolase [Longimicrobiales bacterium]